MYNNVIFMYFILFYESQALGIKRTFPVTQFSGSHFEVNLSPRGCLVTFGDVFNGHI